MGPHTLPATAHSYLERSATSLRDGLAKVVEWRKAHDLDRSSRV